MISLEGITTALQSWMQGTLGDTWSYVATCVLIGIAAITLFAVLGLALVYMERKVAA